MTTATLELPSSFRASYASTGATTMADNLPSLNFGFDDLRTRMNEFTQRFDEFIEQGRKRVLEERNQFRINVANLQESQAASQRALLLLRSKSASHGHTLSSQSAETAEMRETIDSLTTVRDKHLSAIDTVRAKLQTTRSAVATKKASNRKQTEYARSQARADDSEVGFWEEALGMKVDGVGVADRVKFTFIFEDGGRRKEAWFELEMPGGKGARRGGEEAVQGYRIVGSEPRMEVDRAEECLGRMNDGREDLARFLKGMRGLMRESIA